MADYKKYNGRNSERSRRISDELEKSGKSFSDGMADGIEKNSESVKSAAQKLADSAVKAIKGALKIHSPSRVMRDEVGKYISLGVASGITQNDKYVVKSFKAIFEKLNYQRDLDLISEDEYYTELEHLRDSYFSEGTKEWVKYTAKIYKYQQKVLEEEKKALEKKKKLLNELDEYAADKLDSIIAKQEKYALKLRKYGSLFKHNTLKFDNDEVDFYSLSDFNKDIEALKKYDSLMTEVKDKIKNFGFSDEVRSAFLSEAGNLPVDEAIKCLEALTKAGDNVFNDYFSAYSEKYMLSGDISSRWYKDEFDAAVDENIEYMREKLTEAGYEIPETFFETGKISAENFGSSFSSSLDFEFKKIKEKIEQFNSNLFTKSSSELSRAAGGTVVEHNETYSSNYSISAQDGSDIVSQLKNYDTVRRLAGIGG